MGNRSVAAPRCLFRQNPIYVRQRHIPRVVSLLKIDLAPRAGVSEVAARVASQLAAANALRPEEVDKGCRLRSVYLCLISRQYVP